MYNLAKVYNGLLALDLLSPLAGYTYGQPTDALLTELAAPQNITVMSKNKGGY